MDPPTVGSTSFSAMQCHGSVLPEPSGHIEVARALPKPWRAKALGAVAQGLDKTLVCQGFAGAPLCRRAMAFQGHAAAHCVTFGQSAAAGKGRSTFFTMGSEQISRARALTRAFHRAMLAR